MYVQVWVRTILFVDIQWKLTFDKNPPDSTMKTRFKKDLNLQIYTYKDIFEIWFDFRMEKWGFLNRDMPVLLAL